MSQNLIGGYELAAMEECSLPEQVATGFGQVMATLLGAKYLPVLYVGKQIVHGTNHMLICRQSLATLGAPEHLVKLVINQNQDDGSVAGQWSLVSIEQII